MGRVFLTCFSPLLLREKQPSIHIDEAVSLVSSLSIDLEKLESSLAENFLSLRWCSEATNLFKKMHFQFLLMFEKFQVPLFEDGVNHVNEYMEETLKILDLCNLLKLAISGMHRYRLMVEVAVRKFRDQGSSNAMHMTEIGKLESEHVNLRGIEKWKDVDLLKAGTPKRKSRANPFCAVYVVKRMMNIVRMLLFSAILYPVSIELDEEVYRDFPPLESFSFSLGKLVSCLSEGRQGMQNDLRPLLFENQVMERAVEEMKVQVLNGEDLDKEKFQRSIDSLESSSLALKESLEVFDSVVADLFDEVVRGRNKILGSFAAS